MEYDNNLSYNYLPKRVLDNKIRKLEGKLIGQNQQIIKLAEKLACLNVENNKKETCVVQKSSKFLS